MFVDVDATSVVVLAAAVSAVFADVAVAAAVVAAAAAVAVTAVVAGVDVAAAAAAAVAVTAVAVGAAIAAVAAAAAAVTGCCSCFAVAVCYFCQAATFADLVVCKMVHSKFSLVGGEVGWCGVGSLSARNALTFYAALETALCPFLGSLPTKLASCSCLLPNLDFLKIHISWPNLGGGGYQCFVSGRGLV
jgi:hypothetical protein